MTTASVVKARRVSGREERKRRDREKRLRDKQLKAAAVEAKAEQLAPKIQREGVPGLRGPRVEAEHISFRRSNPVRHLVARQRNKPEPMFRKVHEDASDRLLTAWETAGGGISAASSSYGERVAGSASTGMIADHILASVNEQIKARDDIVAAQAFLGALWPIVFCVVIRGFDVSAVADMASMSPEVAQGYLAAALDRLVELYAPKEERRARIRTIEFAVMTLEEPDISK